MWIIWIVLGFVIGYLVTWSSRPILTPVESSDWSRVEKEINDDILKRRQQSEDLRIEMRINQIANDQFREYLNADMITIGNHTFKNLGIFLPEPIGIYNLYDEQTAKYFNTDLTALIRDRYRNLVEEYESENK